MLTGWPQSLATLVIAAAFYGLDFFLMARYAAQRRAEGSGRSWGYTLAMLSAAAFVVVQPVRLPWLGFHTAAAWGLVVQIVGAGLMAFGLALHFWARLHLRHFYAERVEVQPEHRIVDTGPYARVRHPVFTSFFLTVAGLFLVNPALPTALLAAYAFWDFSRAAQQEECLLTDTLPGYAGYMARTGRFLPKL
jgi:protein-S-isoprenylcysteine O-methyltransferase Ste14